MSLHLIRPFVGLCINLGHSVTTRRFLKPIPALGSSPPVIALCLRQTTKNSVSKNGMLGTVEKVDDGKISVRLDDASQTRVTINANAVSQLRSRLRRHDPQIPRGNRRPSLCVGVTHHGRTINLRRNDTPPERPAPVRERKGPTQVA